MNLLVFNLAMDANHTALGFTTSWVNALARRTGHVSVITMSAGEIAVDDNVTVHSLGKELGYSEPRRLARFYRLVAQVLRERPVHACLAHMAPLFASLFAPVARARRIPILLWYAHGAVSRTVRVAHRLVDRCVTSTPAAFGLPSDKLFVIGQGIDTGVFRPPTEVPDGYWSTALSIGRITPAKRLDEMVSALSFLRREHGLDVRLELTGEPLGARDRAYEANLCGMVDELGLRETVDFAGRVPFPEVPSRYHHGSLFLNLSETRSIDKAILESMASGCVPISRNESFRVLASQHGLEGLVPEPGPSGMAAAVAAELRRPREDRGRLASRLRAIVEEEHSLNSLTDRLLHHLGELVEAR